MAVRPPVSRPSAADRVRKLLARDEPLVMGGFYDGVSARLVERAGFPLAFMGGYAVAASLLGEPDIGLLTQAEMADAARRLCRLISAPVLVDADTGYGNVPNVVRTAELYAQAGAAGLFLEDQVWPKRCGHMAGKEVVDRREWLTKLNAVVKLRPALDLFVVARTDARGPKGLVQPAIKCRGPEYLRIIYGPEYDAPEHLVRLRKRGLGLKRALAVKEFALGAEALERFVAREPLRRVHECVFAILALESEPVDPRL